MARGPKGKDDGRRFPPEAIAVLRQRVARYRRRFRLTWLGLAEAITSWDRITTWFPQAFEKPVERTAEPTPKREKPDQDWVITERVLLTWIRGDTRRGRQRDFHVPELPKLQAIASYMVWKKAISERQLAGQMADFRFVSELSDAAGISIDRQSTRSWAGQYVSRAESDHLQLLHELTIHFQEEEQTFFATVSFARSYKRRDAVLDAVSERLSDHSASGSATAGGWAIPLGASTLLVLLRPGAHSVEDVIPCLFERTGNESRELTLVWASDRGQYLGVTSSNILPILTFEKDNLVDAPDFELRRRPGIVQVIRSAMVNSSRRGVVAAVREVDVDLLGSSWAGDAIGIQQCLRDGANVNVYKVGTFQTPLHLAITARNLDAIELLLAQPGMRVDVDDVDDRTPSEYALIYMGDDELSQRLADLEEAEYERDQAEAAPKPPGPDPSPS